MSTQIRYTTEKTLRIIIALLKTHGVKKVIASPGTTNMTLVASMQNDPWFEMYSCVDERSAAYMGCGLVAEIGEPVVITCTEATSARNYLPGLTEAYYRKLPVLAITTTHGAYHVGSLLPQVIDHSVQPNDVALERYFLPLCENEREMENTTLKVNDAILELHHRGGGPVFMNVETLASREYSDAPLPNVRKIERFTLEDALPVLPDGRIGIFLGTHKLWSEQQTEALDRFCAWAAQQLMESIPSGSYVHYSILGAFRAGNFFVQRRDLFGSCNVGGFGIDGTTSTFIGASLAHKDTLHYLFIGDLAFFYDLNAIGNRHVGCNIRILLVNNGDGTEFRQRFNQAYEFTKEYTDEYIADGGHYGRQSPRFVRHMAEDLGFEYLVAFGKETFVEAIVRFTTPASPTAPCSWKYSLTARPTARP